jgi:hypothetical protein
MAAQSNQALQHLMSELQQALGETEVRAEAEYKQVLQLLRAFTVEVSAFLSGPNLTKTEVTLELGHAVELGQEYRVVVAASAIGLQDFLLRAFVPADGYPVTLDYAGGPEVRCESEDKLVAELVNAIRSTAIQSRLLAIRQALSDETLRGERRIVGTPKQRSSPGGQGHPRASKRSGR